MRPTASSSWTTASSSRRERHSGCSRPRARSAPARSSPRSHAEAIVDGFSRFIETFFKWELIERYFPSILKGVVVTIEIATAVVVTGILLGLVLAVVRSVRLVVVNAL